MNLEASVNHGEHGGHGEKPDFLDFPRDHPKGDRTSQHKFSLFAVSAVPAVVNQFAFGLKPPA
jgi:hypothetical protein